MLTREDAWSACKDHLALKEKELREILDDLNEGMLSETKSTAGDKHETGRAMMHIEKEKIARQLADLLSQRNALEGLQHSTPQHEIRPGSLVQTNHGVLYLAVGLGKIEADGKNFIAISPQSPLGKQLAGKKTGERCVMNAIEYHIQHIA